ncbi:helix-turn-helix domain-containing protein [Arthrobacter sp.]|uniref:helix-turn-helix domain-containing protein n=1 Tax=Arthrobacter sp. TaxID=1667 RepID=UPI003A8F9DFF
MSSRGEILRGVMLETGTTQMCLSRMSGVHQPSISQFLSGKVDFSDEQLDRLLSCMERRLEVVRRPVRPELTHSERRSWMLHRKLSTRLTMASLQEWLPRLVRNFERLRHGVRGTVHRRNIQQWLTLIDHSDIIGLHRAMTGLDRTSIEMREVSPFGGILPEEQRREVLDELRRAS